MESKEEKIERIKKFLEGHDDQKYITAIEGDFFSNEVKLIIDHPTKGKYLEVQKFTPFLYIKDFKKLNKILYKTKSERQSTMKYYGISITKLRTDDHPRLEHGYNYKISTSKDYGALIRFFKQAGYNIFSDPEKLFLKYSGIEQFLMSTGKRLFKGFDKYQDVHKFYFDIETTSLKPEEGNIFLIGIKDNRGFNKVLSIDLENPVESERQMIIDFFQIIQDLKPTIIAGYNSEAFDFHYILGRAKILDICLGVKDEDGNYVYDVKTSLSHEHPLQRKPSTIKFGGETENYEKTIMWGMNVIDISHSVRATKAINSDIKGWGLKYICQYKGFAAPNRMYVAGDKIYKIWEENKLYYINNSNNNYRVIPNDFQDNSEEYINKLRNILTKTKTKIEQGLEVLPKQLEIHDFFGGEESNINIITGKEIINQYLLDDLSETEMVDNDFNQSNFMMGGILPTDYVRASTMGNASKWKMLMTTYSFENDLAIPVTDRKRDIVGGLSRLFRTGFAKNVLKMDFASLYPSIQLTHNVFPTLDITGVMEAMLHYFRDGRAEYKNLSKKHAKLFAEFGKEIDKELASLFDTKQLPIKILANSQFGALSSPAIFNWGDNAIGEEITCTGRQYLRSMVYHFMQYNFLPIVLDTDGANLSVPDGAENITCKDNSGNLYMGKRKNKETGEMEDYVLTGYEAVLAEYNDKYMTGVMGLALDGLYAATINISRKNYADLNLDNSFKIVGNSLKSSTLQAYVENTFKTSIDLLLQGKGKEFIELYYEQLEKIYNKEIPLIQIANKSRVKQKVSDYKKDLLTKVNKNGRGMARKAYMELLIEANLEPDMGQNIYYVNNGTAKSHGDLGHSYLIDENDFISNPNKTGDYNVARYIDIFNKRMQVFLACFSPVVRENLIITNPEKRNYFSDAEMELVSGQPIKVGDEDVLYPEDIIGYDGSINGEFNLNGFNEPLFEMSEREIKFWNRSTSDPRVIFPHFSTVFSKTKLLSQEEKGRIKNEEEKIINYFRDKEVILKKEYDYLLDKDLIIKYSKEFIKIDAETLGEEIINLDRMEWIISKYEYGSLCDLEIISDDIYK